MCVLFFSILCLFEIRRWFFFFLLLDNFAISFNSGIFRTLCVFHFDIKFLWFRLWEVYPCCAWLGRCSGFQLGEGIPRNGGEICGSQHRSSKCFQRNAAENIQTIPEVLVLSYWMFVFMHSSNVSVSLHFVGQWIRKFNRSKWILNYHTETHLSPIFSW